MAHGQVAKLLGLSAETGTRTAFHLRLEIKAVISFLLVTSSAFYGNR